MSTNLLKRLKILLFAFCFLYSCASKKDGCLDINATNFDVSADQSCGDCCTYPTLKLTFSHKIVPAVNPDSTANFKYNTAYQIPFDTSEVFDIERIRFHVSNFKLIDLQGNKIGVLDTIQLENDFGPFTVEDNFAKVDRDIFTASSIGTFIGGGQYVGAEFEIGLDSEIQNAKPASTPSNHPLNINNDSLLYDSIQNTYLTSLIILNRDTLSSTDSTEIKLYESVSIPINFGLPVTIYEGFNLNIQIQIDYLKWFENIDIQLANIEEIELQILENLPNAFEIMEIKLE